MANIKSVLGKHFLGAAALNMSLSEARIGLLDLCHLLWTQLDLVCETAFFELEQPLVTSTHFMLIENILNGRIADSDPFQCKTVAELVASPGRIFQAKCQYPLHLLGRGDQGIGFGNGWKSLQSLNPIRLKSTFVLVKLGT